MKLCSRITLITLLLIFCVQALNCFLEVGFLAGNLEAANRRKFSLVGGEIQRKLNISLIFGKPLTHLNYDRLLSGLVDSELENLYVLDPQGHLVYSFKEEGNLKIKSHPNQDSLVFPLSDRSGGRGQMVLDISQARIQDRLWELVKKSVFNFLGILPISFILLYWVLNRFITRPHDAFIRKMEASMDQGDFKALKDSGIDLMPLEQARKAVAEAKSGTWIKEASLARKQEILRWMNLN